MKIRPHRYLLYGGLRFLGAVLRLVPLNAASGFGAALGRIAYAILPHERKKTVAHLTWVFEKEKSPAEIRRIARKVFANLGRNAAEWLKMPRLSDAQIVARVEVENFEIVEEALRGGKGIILLTGHFGNWEWLAAYFGSLRKERGYAGGVLAKRIYFEPYNRLLVNLRASHGVETYFRDESPRKILKALGQNHILGILPDQDVKKIDGIFIPFFGKDAYTPTAPVAIAMASGAPLVPVFLIREGRKFRMSVEKPIAVRRAEDKAEALRRHTIEWSGILEKYLKRYPDQWVWMHRRWKTRPETATGKVYEKKLA